MHILRIVTVGSQRRPLVIRPATIVVFTSDHSEIQSVDGASDRLTLGELA